MTIFAKPGAAGVGVGDTSPEEGGVSYLRMPFEADSAVMGLHLWPGPDCSGRKPARDSVPAGAGFVAAVKGALTKISVVPFINKT